MKTTTKVFLLIALAILLIVPLSACAPAAEELDEEYQIPFEVRNFKPEDTLQVKAGGCQIDYKVYEINFLEEDVSFVLQKSYNENSFFGAFMGDVIILSTETCGNFAIGRVSEFDEAENTVSIAIFDEPVFIHHPSATKVELGDRITVAIPGCPEEKWYHFSVNYADGEPVSTSFVWDQQPTQKYERYTTAMVGDIAYAVIDCGGSLQAWTMGRIMSITDGVVYIDEFDSYSISSMPLVLEEYDRFYLPALLDSILWIQEIQPNGSVDMFYSREYGGKRYNVSVGDEIIINDPDHEGVTWAIGVLNAIVNDKVDISLYAIPVQSDKKVTYAESVEPEVWVTMFGVIGEDIQDLMCPGDPIQIVDINSVGSMHNVTLKSNEIELSFGFNDVDLPDIELIGSWEIRPLLVSEDEGEYVFSWIQNCSQ